LQLAILKRLFWPLFVVFGIVPRAVIRRPYLIRETGTKSPKFPEFDLGSDSV
jgi:hypothetical protein